MKSLLFKNGSTVKCSILIFLIWALFFFVSEEDSDEIKIGTSCKNGGCSKVCIVKFVLCYGSKILILKEECNLLTWFNKHLGPVFWALCRGLGLQTWMRDCLWQAPYLIESWEYVILIQSASNGHLLCARHCLQTGDNSKE